MADAVGGDPLGNTWALRRGSGAARPALLLSAHLDTIGLVVTRLLPGGFLRFSAIGGVDVRALPGREVRIAGRREIAAAVATLPPHLTSPAERRRLPRIEDLVLDTGHADAELERLVRPGDRAFLAGGPAELLGGAVMGPGLDNRAGVACLHEALLAVAGAELPCDLWVLANVQEEVGLRGIGPAARRLRPTAAVVVDTGFARQAGVPDEDARAAGGGPVLAVGPALHPAVGALVEAAAARARIPLQREAIAGPSGTDAWPLAVAAGGIPVGLLSIPLRSMHTPAECVQYRDVEAAGRLLAAVAQRTDRQWAARLSGPLWTDGDGPW